MKEIKEHPWYKRDLPQYIQDLSIIASKKKTEEVNTDIV